MNKILQSIASRPLEGGVERARSTFRLTIIGASNSGTDNEIHYTWTQSQSMNAYATSNIQRIIRSIIHGHNNVNECIISTFEAVDSTITIKKLL